MNAIGGQEVLMTTLQNPEIWKNQIDGMRRWWIIGLSPNLSLVEMLVLLILMKNLLQHAYTLYKFYKDLSVYVYQFQTNFEMN